MTLRWLVMSSQTIQTIPFTQIIAFKSYLDNLGKPLNSTLRNYMESNCIHWRIRFLALFHTPLVYETYHRVWNFLPKFNTLVVTVPCHPITGLSAKHAFLWVKLQFPAAKDPIVRHFWGRKGPLCKAKSQMRTLMWGNFSRNHTCQVAHP